MTGLSAIHNVRHYEERPHGRVSKDAKRLTPQRDSRILYTSRWSKPLSLGAIAWRTSPAVALEIKPYDPQSAALTVMVFTVLSQILFLDGFMCIFRLGYRGEPGL